jgi:drug/metabolite transporter (DMT)-like permease
VELIGATLTGYFAFNEIPGPRTMIGGAFIVAAGFILLAQDRRGADGMPPPDSL